MPGHQVGSTEKMGECFTDLANRHEEVKRRCRTVLQASAAEPTGSAQVDSPGPTNGRFHLGFGVRER